MNTAIPPAYAGVAQDAGRERRAEQRLQTFSERTFQFCGVLDAGGVVLEASQTALRANGLRAEQLIGRRIWEAPVFRASALAQELLRCGVGSAARGEEVRVELPVLAADGSSSVVDLAITPLRAAGECAGSLLVDWRDVTQLAVVRDDLAVAEERLSQAVAAANIGLWDWNVATNEVWYSDQFLAMLGYQPGELPATGNAFMDITHPEDRDAGYAAIVDVLAGRRTQHRNELRRRCKDGSWRWVVDMGRAVQRRPDGKAVRVSGVQLDITERRELDERRAAAQRLESLGRLSAGLAHEINTPMQIVQDSLYFLEEAVGALLVQAAAGAGPESAQARYGDSLPGAVARARAGVERVAAIVSSMQQYAQSGDRHAAPTDIRRVIDAALRATQHEWRDVAELVTEHQDGVRVGCYAEDLCQAIAHLVRNAAQAIRDARQPAARGGRIRIRTWRDAGWACIAVEDDGAGIAEQVRNQIFEPFFTTREVGGGLGQGLTVARAIIVGMHAGEIDFTTTPGCGTRFQVRLPINAQEGPRAGAAA